VEALPNPSEVDHRYYKNSTQRDVNVRYKPARYQYGSCDLTEYRCDTSVYNYNLTMHYDAPYEATITPKTSLPQYNGYVNSYKDNITGFMNKNVVMNGLPGNARIHDRSKRFGNTSR
jgi:hypothetical protein